MPTITYKGRRIRLTQRMLEFLDCAAKYPKPGAWHDIGKHPAERKAVDRLKAEGSCRDF